MKLRILLLFVIALLALIFTGCNTARGFGDDMEVVGEKMRKDAD